MNNPDLLPEAEYIPKDKLSPQLLEILDRHFTEPTTDGRRASGKIISADELPDAAKPKPVCENPDKVIVPKRTALSVARELLYHKRPERVRCFETHGYCYIMAHYSGDRQTSWRGRNWFLALANLQQSLS